MRLIRYSSLFLTLLAAPALAQATDPLAPGEHEVELRGIKIWYLVRGSGPAMLVQPGGAGWGGDATIYVESLRRLEATRTVVYYDPRGIGRSGRSADPALYTMDEYVEDLEALRDYLGFESFDIAGHSHGGFVALKYALAYPDRVDRLLVLNSGAFLGELPQGWLEARKGYEEAHARLANADTRLGADEAHAELIRVLAPVAHFRDYERVREVVDDWLARTTFSAEPFQQYVREPFDLRDQVGEIRAATLIVVGDDDFPFLREGSYHLHERIPGAQLFVVPGSGHWSAIERPDLFFPALLRFLSNDGP